jgi:hypothetical protein
MMIKAMRGEQKRGKTTADLPLVMRPQVSPMLKAEKMTTGNMRRVLRAGASHGQSTTHQHMESGL